MIFTTMFCFTRNFLKLSRKFIPLFADLQLSDEVCREAFWRRFSPHHSHYSRHNHYVMLMAIMKILVITIILTMMMIIMFVTISITLIIIILECQY